MTRKSCKRVGLGLVLLLAASGAGWASSHREAPAITEMPKVDGTDFYMFNSYEAGRSGFVTLIANYLPLQDSYGGPNYFTLDPDARYRIHIDNTGDGVEDISFQFRCTQLLRDIKLPVGGSLVSVPVINVGQITSGPAPLDPDLNLAESCTLAVLRGRITGAAAQLDFATDADSGATRFPKTTDNIGQKSIPNYHDYAQQFIRPVSIPGCGGEGRVFIGQRRESFAVNLGEIFDLVNIENPLGPPNAEPNEIGDKNITSFILEVPESCLTAGSNPVIGGWTTATLRRERTLRTNPTFQRPADEGGGAVQVSRLGMPLVNEVVIGLKDKNLFNASHPSGDAALATYVTNPTLPGDPRDPVRRGGRPRAQQLPAPRPGGGLRHRHPGDQLPLRRPAARDAAPQHLHAPGRGGVAEQPRRPGRRRRRLPQRAAAGRRRGGHRAARGDGRVVPSPSPACSAAMRTTRLRGLCRSPTARSRTPASSIRCSRICAIRSPARPTK